MKKVSIYFVLFCICAALTQYGITQVQQRGVAVEAETGNSGGGATSAGRQITGQKYAVLVGVTEYKHMPNLRFTKNDAEALRDQLIAIGFDRNNVRTLTSGSSGNNEPTKQNIESAVSDILGRAKEGDLVIISLSGHGTQPSDLGPLFCPPEADRGNLRNTTVAINAIRDSMGNCGASFKLLIVDACRDDQPFGTAMSAPMINSGARTVSVSFATNNTDLGFKGVKLESVDTNAPLQNLTVFQSCSPGQLSWEDGRLNHGIFTHFVVDGLRGRAANRRGDITLDTLLTYARTETSYYVEESEEIQRLQRAQQHPWRAGEGNDFVLANINRNNLPNQPQEIQREIRRITTLDLPQQPNELPKIPDGERRINVATTAELLRAVNPANLKDGDVIVLKPGLYSLNESLNISRHPLDKRSGTPIVLFGDPSDPEKVKIRINRRDGKINITRNTPVYLIGLDISSANGVGIQVEGEAEGVGIQFCSVRDCKGDGIYNRCRVFMENSVIARNGNGFQSGSGGRSDVENSRIEYNTGYGVSVSSTSKGRFSNNILFDNVGGNWRVAGAAERN